MEDNGQLIKVLIHSYEDEEFSEPTPGLEVNPISLPVNPESFTQNFRIGLNQQQAQGNQGTNSDYTATKPEELRLEFVFDGTEIIEGYKYNGSDHSVRGQLEIFLKTIYEMNGETHRPPLLKIQWGKFFFQGVLSNLDLNYTLFKSNGDPLRVKANATFVKYIPQKERVARERKRSPDLTHVELVKGGDRLDLMTYKIYKESNFVIQVAKANGLSTFREIPIGKELVFPPLDKTNNA